MRSLERQVAKYLSASHGHLPSPPRPLSDMRFQRLAGSIHGLALRAYKAERSSAARHEDTGLEQLQAFISESNADLRRNMQDALQGVRNDINVSAASVISLNRLITTAFPCGQSLARIVASFDFHSARVAEQAEDTDRAATTGILLDEQQPAVSIWWTWHTTSLMITARSPILKPTPKRFNHRGAAEPLIRRFVRSVHPAGDVSAADNVLFSGLGQADRGAGGDLSTGNRDSAETRDFRGTGDARSSSHEVAQFVQHSVGGLTRCESQ